MNISTRNAPIFGAFYYFQIKNQRRLKMLEYDKETAAERQKARTNELTDKLES